MFDKIRTIVRVAVFASLIVPLIALAQALAAVPDGVQRVGTGTDILSTIVSAIAVPLITALGGILVGWLNSRRQAAAAKAGTDVRAAIEQRLLGLVDLVGGRLWTEIEDDLRKALADGRLTEEERDLLEEKIEAALKSLLTPSGMKEVIGVFGLPAAVQFILNFLSQRVFSTKKAAQRAAVEGTLHEVPAIVLYRPPSPDEGGPPMPAARWDDNVTTPQG